MSGNNGNNKEYVVRNIEVADGKGSKASYPCVTCVCGNANMIIMAQSILCPACNFAINFEKPLIDVTQINNICKGAHDGTIPINKI